MVWYECERMQTNKDIKVMQGLQLKRRSDRVQVTKTLIIYWHDCKSVE